MCGLAWPSAFFQRRAALELGGSKLTIGGGWSREARSKQGMLEGAVHNRGGVALSINR